MHMQGWTQTLSSPSPHHRGAAGGMVTSRAHQKSRTSQVALWAPAAVGSSFASCSRVCDAHTSCREFAMLEENLCSATSRACMSKVGLAIATVNPACHSRPTPRVATIRQPCSTNKRPFVCLTLSSNSRGYSHCQGGVPTPAPPNVAGGRRVDNMSSAGNMYMLHHGQRIRATTSPSLSFQGLLFPQKSSTASVNKAAAKPP
jgi:hypothetical protein